MSIMCGRKLLCARDYYARRALGKVLAYNAIRRHKFLFRSEPSRFPACLQPPRICTRFCSFQFSRADKKKYYSYSYRYEDNIYSVEYFVLKVCVCMCVRESLIMQSAV